MEEYGKAADIRDKILALEEADPVLKLEAQLKAAIESQHFEVQALLARTDTYHSYGLNMKLT